MGALLRLRGLLTFSPLCPSPILLGPQRLRNVVSSSKLKKAQGPSFSFSSEEQGLKRKKNSLPLELCLIMLLTYVKASHLGQWLKFLELSVTNTLHCGFNFL